MTISPSVVLRYDDARFSPVDFRTVSVGEQDLETALSRALIASRVFVAQEAKKRLIAGSLINPVTINYAIDTAWQMFLPKFGRLTGSYLARAYWEGFRAAEAGDVPAELLDELAENYARKLGTYYNDTSREAVIEGFNTYVNRQVSSRMAMERALNAYGLTSRQMRGYTSGKFDAPKSSPLSLNLKREATEYIARSVEQRVRIIAGQEAHNLSMEARQTAWMWLEKQGKITAEAEKVWLTAKDERVCKTCGPMHGKRVKVLERFEIPDGQMLYVPGVHVNCRCTIRLVDTGLIREAVAKADFQERKHPRDRRGRFAEKDEEPQFKEKFVPSPELQEMTRRAEELRAQRAQEKARRAEETKPITWTKPEDENKISFGTSDEKIRFKQGPITFDKPITWEQDKPVSWSEKSSQETSDKITWAGTTESKLQGLQGEQLVFSTKERLELHDSFLDMFRDMSARSLRDRSREQRDLTRPTIPTPPVFAVLEKVDMDAAGPEELNLNHTTIFYRSPVEAAAQATKIVEARIESAIEDMELDYGNELTEDHPIYGRLHADISQRDIKEMVKFIARRAGYLYERDEGTLGGLAAADALEDPSLIGDSNVQVEWLDAEGKPVGIPDQLRYSELAQKFDLDPEDFQVWVLEMNEGWDQPDTDRLTLRDVDSQYGPEIWTTQGRYVENTMKRHTTQVGGGYPVIQSQIEPDVAMEDFERTESIEERDKRHRETGLA